MSSRLPHPRSWALPAFLALLALGLVGAASPTTKPAAGATTRRDQARALLARVQTTYRGLRSYRFEGTTTMELIGSQPAQPPAQLALLFIASKPGRSRAEIHHPNMGSTLISDSTTVTLFSQSLNQYRQIPAQVPPGSNNGPPPTFNPFTEYETVVERATSARILRRESVTVDGRTIPCTVVAVALGPGPGGAGDTAHATYWVDTRRALVLKDVSETLSRQGADGAPIAIRESTQYTSARADVTIADSTFAFTPPAGATLVERFGAAPAESRIKGTAATEFTLADLGGAQHSLSRYRGQVVMLDFWATWCGPCRMEMPSVQKLHEELESRGLKVLSINLREPRERADAFVRKYGYTFTTLLDSDGRVAENYDAPAIPTLVIIDREGKVVEHFMGVRPEATIREALRKVGIE
jgi:peroxiredoxin/outer membrane lipoprotein-sorting protein